MKLIERNFLRWWCRHANKGKSTSTSKFAFAAYMLGRRHGIAAEEDIQEDAKMFVKEVERGEA